MVVEVFENRCAVRDVDRSLHLLSSLLNHIKVNRPIITPEETASIFLNISNIYDFNSACFTQLSSKSPARL